MSVLGRIGIHDAAGGLRSVVADRADIDDLDAGARQLRHPAADRVLAAAALGDLHVLGIGAAEQHHEPAVPRDRRPRRERAGHRLRRAEHMRQELERRAEAVVGVLVDEAAERRQEAARLRARFVEDAGRSPSRSEPPMIAAWPCSRLTRASSPARRDRARAPMTPARTRSRPRPAPLPGPRAR